MATLLVDGELCELEFGKTTMHSQSLFAHIVVLAAESEITFNAQPILQLPFVAFLRVDRGLVEIFLQKNDEDCNMTAENSSSTDSDIGFEIIQPDIDLDDEEVEEAEDQRSATFSAMMRFFQKHNPTFKWQCF